jgi:hypothetical protein
MTPTFRKLEVKDIGSLEKLVAENVEGIEPGLKIVDSRLLLGQAAIDLVGLDTRGSLVLIALDFTPDEGLLLRVMDAYSWCLEYPDTIRRLYPMAQLSASRPPRILFIVERITDSFLRRIKQLSVVEIDCLEFRHFEMNGASAVYFDLVERLRKSTPAVLTAEAVAAFPAAAPIAVVAPPAPVVAAVAPLVASSAPPIMEAAVPVAPPVAPAVVPAPVAQVPAAPPVVALVAASTVREPLVLQFAAAAPAESPTNVEPPVLVEQPVEAELPVKVEEPVTVEPPVEIAINAPAPAWPPLVLESPLNGAAHAVIEATIEEIARPALVIGNEAETVDAYATVAPAPVPEPVSELVVEMMPVESALEAVSPEPFVRIEAPVEPEPVVPALAPALPVWAKPQAPVGVGRPYFFAQASKGGTLIEIPAAPASVASTIEEPIVQITPAVPAPPPVPAAPVAAAAPVAPAKPAAPQVNDEHPALESLSFPKDGLSRQWLEFLSQLGATK